MKNFALLALLAALGHAGPTLAQDAVTVPRGQEARFGTADGEVICEVSDSLRCYNRSGQSLFCTTGCLGYENQHGLADWAFTAEGFARPDLRVGDLTVTTADGTICRLNEIGVVCDDASGRRRGVIEGPGVLAMMPDGRILDMRQ